MSYKLTDTITVYERDDWGARPWRDFTPQSWPSEVFIHHGAESNAEQMTSLAKQVQAMRATQNFHMGPQRGWSDIAYHYVVFQPYGNVRHARVFEGRPVRHVPAAQLGHNTGTLAICVYGNFDGDDQVKANTRYAIDVLLTRKPSLTGCGAVETLGGHRDVTQTTCPGNALYAQLGTIADGAHLRRYR